MKQTRREFIKINAVAATAAAAGITIPGVQAIAAGGDKDIRWDKAPCRFCGTGCSVLVGTKGDRVVATQGDPEADPGDHHGRNEHSVSPRGSDDECHAGQDDAAADGLGQRRSFGLPDGGDDRREHGGQRL